MVAKVFTTATNMQKKKKKKPVNIDADLTPFIKINSKWITNLNVPCRTVNLLTGDTEL